MIAMPRFARPLLRTRPGRPASGRALRWWHVVCMLPGAGCLSIEPIPPEPVDHDPIILAPSDPIVPNGTEFAFTMISDPDTIEVIATDPDPTDDLTFSWVVPHGAPYTIVAGTPQRDTANQETLFSSVLVLPWNTVLDGSKITCHVFDGQKEVVLTFDVTLEHS